MKSRCSWLNLKNEKYVKYHDEVWAVETHNDKELYKRLLLECFQAGLSFEIVLNKEEYFNECYDNFDIDKVINYDESKINELMNNNKIIRNKLKIKASIENSKIFKKIQEEFKSFDNYIWGWTNNKIIYETNKSTSELSDRISKDLKKRNMSFVGSKVIYSYLQAIGVINSHEENCFKYHEKLIK